MRIYFKRWKLWLGSSTALVLALVLALLLAVRWAMKNPDVPAYDVANVQIVYQEHQWEDWMRQYYYEAPQGTRVVGLGSADDPATPLAYSWILHLERPFSRERFARPAHLARFGFLINEEAVDAREEYALPVGFAKHRDPAWWPANGDPDADRSADVLDLGCAACHTGELYYRTENCGTGPPPRVASPTAKLCGLRVDGGQAMHAIAASSMHLRAQSFAQEMVASMGATYLNPAKWRRFEKKVLEYDGDEHADELRGQFRKVLWQFVKKSMADCGAKALVGGCEHYPTEEGPGRTDALGRIANTLFSHVDLEYLRVADAPVSYPHVWDIWLFDLVQWGHSVRQPMGRNVGETLGVGASVLTSPDDPFASSVRVTDLYCTEEILRELNPPRWPETVLPPVDPARAEEGAKLYARHCHSCHGVLPQKQPPNDKPVEWILRSATVDRVGTDPRSARNFLCRKYDMEETYLASAVHDYMKEKLPAVAAGKGANGRLKELCQPIEGDPDEPRCDAENPLLCPTAAKVLELVTIGVQAKAYRDLGLTDAEKHDFDGFGLGTKTVERPVYKARPLEGIWATPPYLHNGSVRTIYQLLSPPHEREDTCWVGSREFDPKHLGYRSERQPGAFLFDTRLPGNANSGHLFVGAGDEWKGIDGAVGPALSHRQRLQILEYLKVHEDLPPDVRALYWHDVARNPAELTPEERARPWPAPERCRALWNDHCENDPDLAYCRSLPSEWRDASYARQ